jgi:hypothetical protein
MSYNKILDTLDYKYTQNHLLSINLSDQVILFNIDSSWKVIPLFVSLSYPIIYDKIDKQTVSIVVCPISLRCSVFKAKYIFDKYHDNIMILTNTDTTEQEPITQKIIIDNKTLLNNSKRYEIKIMTLKNALMLVPDLLILETNKSITPIKPLLNLKYYTNKYDINNNKIKSEIHPKTLVYVVKYKSLKSNKDKKIILFGSNISKNTVSGYDLHKSGIMNYLEKYKYKILENIGYIYPILWFTQLSKNDFKIIQV